MIERFPQYFERSASSRRDRQIKELDIFFETPA